MIYYSDKALTVEPSRVHYLHFVKSINIANVGRTVSEPPCGCAMDSSIYRSKDEEGKVITRKTGMIGDIKVIPGYNCRLYQSDNSIVVSAYKGAGASLTEAQNSEIKLYDTETKPSASDFYSGGISCEDTVKAINGINAKTINIMGGPGIDVQYEDNTITISVIKPLFNEGCEDSESEE